ASLLESEESIYVTTVPWSKEVLQFAAHNELDRLPTFPEMAAPHTALIMNEGRFKACYLAGFSYGGELSLAVARHLRPPGVEVAGHFLFDSCIQTTGLRKGLFWIRRQLREMREEGVAHVLESLRRRLRPRATEKRLELSTASESEWVDFLPNERVPWEIEE